MSLRRNVAEANSIRPKSEREMRVQGVSDEEGDEESRQR